MENHEMKQTMTFGEFLKSYTQKSLAVLKQPKQLIPTLVLGCVWLALSMAASYVKLWMPLQVLSFLTFAQGGMYGGLVGAVGGIVGKVIVATFLNVMIVPLFSGQKPFSGVGTGIMGMFGSMRADSMKAGAMSGRKMPDMQTINRILAGAAIGFTVAATLSLAGLHLCVWIGLFFTVLGTVFTVVGKEKNI